MAGENPIPAGAGGQRATRVLFLDADPVLLAVNGPILDAIGYGVVTTESPSEALGLLAEGTFDVILADHGSARRLGTRLLEEVRRYPPQTVALVLTGEEGALTQLTALREGAYDYLLKPWDPELLCAVVARAAERASLARTMREAIQDLDDANARLRALSERLQERVDEATAELRRGLAELAHANHKLEEAQRQREELISLVAHDLSSPLTSIGGFAQLLLRSSLPEDARSRALETILSESRRLARLVDDLADSARLASGGLAISPAPADLRQILLEQTSLARAHAPHQEIRVAAPDGPLWLDCDADRIAQVLSNLLANAIKYAPASPVHVTLAAIGGAALLTVADEGPGIPGHLRDRIFEPRVRLHGPQAGHRAGSGPRGSGLGLAIAKGIVQAHRGRIWVSQRPGGGAAFHVSLPRRAAATRPSAPHKDARRAA